ncbi:hypothetical protein EUU23_10105 [Sphingorhabdus sp. IMCC26285]|uniref:Uncharacterized protein n=1 Tax=Sphingorhabdus profundilacus TaxID=2509718 RepID=A0A6I4M5Y2_9SPHN|nr:hypothetical protein [Sphingorhabdus profundilacus]MVZ98058.1 hypothetical protein [Sphingorhabdus profundilacus]
MARHYSIKLRAAILTALTLALAAACFGFWLGGWSENGAVLASRYTARVSFYWFIAAWSASSIASIWPGGWRLQLLKRRRAIGLGFATAFGVHFATFFTAIYVFDHSSEITKIIGGGIGYLFAAAMAATSNDWSIKTLGPRRWKLLHALGGWILFAIFSLSYFNSLEPKPFSAIPALLVVVVVIYLRLVVTTKRFRQHRSRHVTLLTQ